MIDIFLAQLPVPTGYETQVWIVSVVATGLMMLKGLQMIQIIWSRKNGNGHAYQTIHEAEFRGKINQLIQNQLEILLKMDEKMNVDREIWKPAINELLKAQASIARLLDSDAKFLREHDEREAKVWDAVLSRIKELNANAVDAWGVCHNELMNVKEAVEVIKEKIEV